MLIKNQTIKLLGLTILCTILSACNLDQEDPVYDAGSADFSKFVSLGDSLTAGYADGALYQMGQKNSFPAILAQQFSLVGGGDFIQPMMSDNLGGLLFNGSPHPDPDTDPGTPVPYPTRLVLNEETQSPVFIDGTPTTEVISNSLTGSFSNMGVPGAKSFHLKSTSYGDPSGLSQNPSTANPYFVRFASTDTTSMIADAAIQQPSFFSLWIGNNDVLSYATSGGIGLDQTGNFDPATYGSHDISDPMVFANIYSALIEALSESGGKGVLMNIPDVLDLPYFTTVPFNPLPLDQATADSLNAFYASNYNMLLEGLVSDEELSQRTIIFCRAKCSAYRR